MALSDYKLGPDGKTVYYQGKPLPAELQTQARQMIASGAGSGNAGNARATQPTQPGFNATVPNTSLAPGGSYPGRTSPPPPPPPGGDPSIYGRTPVLGGSGGGTPPPAGAAPAVVPQPGDGGAKPGTPQWDTQRVNDMLGANGYGDWVVTSATPAKSQKVDPITGDPVPGASANYIINIRNPKTNEIKRLTMNRVWQDANGSLGTLDPTDPQTAEADPSFDPSAWGPGYGYQLGGIEDQQKQDPNKVGHSGQITIGTTLYGTNNATGAFEPVPGAPPIPKDVKGWDSLKQIDDGQGNQIWIGVDPKDGQPKQVPGMPTIPAAAGGYGNPYQVDNGDGSKSWWGIDPATKKPTRIPNMPNTPAPPRGPGSLTQSGVTYVQKPDGSYAPAPGVPNPNQPKGATQVKLGNDGFLYQQTSNGDGTWDVDPSFKPVPFSDAANQSRVQAGAIHQPGDQGIKVIGGKSFPVVYRGGSDDNYDVVPADQGGKATPYPGATDPTSIATSNDQEFIAQRMPDGSVQYIKNQNWAPTDPAIRYRQLSAQANDKFQELQGKLSPSYTPEMAQKDMDLWWSANIDPAQKQIQIDQQKQQVDLQNKIVEQNRSNYATGISAGSGAVAAFTAGQEGRVGPNYGAMMQAIGQGKTSGPEFDNATTFEGPDPNELYKQSMQDALKAISPTAAAASGAPMPAYGQANPTDALNRTQYNFGAPAQPIQGGMGQRDEMQAPPIQANPGDVMQAPPGMLPPPPGAVGRPPFDWMALFNRLGNADVRQAQVAAMGQNPYIYGG
jgi:hypothetical protein